MPYLQILKVLSLKNAYSQASDPTLKSMHLLLLYYSFFNAENFCLEFAKETSEFETMADLKADVTKKLEEAKKNTIILLLIVHKYVWDSLYICKGSLQINVYHSTEGWAYEQEEEENYSLVRRRCSAAFSGNCSGISLWRSGCRCKWRHL